MTTPTNITIQQSSTLPPAQPSYILRGHTAQIHAVQFSRENTRLLTGDAAGWVVLWNLALKRPVAVWRAHTNAVIGLACWTEGKIITHGRDSKLCVWQVREQDEDGLSKVLPVDDDETGRKQPWLLHSLLVHTLNFCSMVTHDLATARPIPGIDHADDRDTLLVAVSGVQDGSILLYALPSEKGVATIPPPRDVKVGMLMAIGLHISPTSDQLFVVAGYESGHAAVWLMAPGETNWSNVYLNNSHSQPVMSLDVAKHDAAFFTSSADAIIARHAFRDGASTTEISQTKHAGQQSLRVRSDGRIFATAGWDGRLRVYSTKTLSELAVLKWHKEGCYAVAFANIRQDDDQDSQSVVARSCTVAQRRLATTKVTHWLAAGSKDGKVSLWSIY